MQQKLFYTKEEVQNLLDIISDFSFEAGRTFENRFISFGLYDTIDFKDIDYANKLGAQWKVNNIDLSISKIQELKIDERKAIALKEPYKKINAVKQMILN